MNERLHVFIHVATLGRYQEILDATVAAIAGTSLYDRATTIEVHVVGDGPVALSHPKAVLFRDDANVARYEFATLAALQERALQDPDSRVLYLNCLGGRYVGAGWDMRARWRELLSYILIERFSTCLDQLQDHDICGIDWSSAPLPHMTSNNWWARSNYIATLLPIDRYQLQVVAEDFSAYDGRWASTEVKKRHAGEFWIGSGVGPRPFSLFPLSSLGLPKGEFGTVSWWDLPGIDWAEAARRKLEHRPSGKMDFRFSALRLKFQIKSALRQLKAAAGWRSTKAETGSV